MIVPAISSLRTEDFPADVQKWIPQLFFPLNQFLDAVTSALNGNITFTDNIPCQKIQLNFTYGGASDFPKIAKWSIPIVAPVEMRVCQATENSVPIAVVPAWSYSNGIVSFAFFSKLSSTGISTFTVGAKYNIILRGQP